MLWNKLKDDMASTNISIPQLEWGNGFIEDELRMDNFVKITGTHSKVVWYHKTART